jgi:hypothetical protein
MKKTGFNAIFSKMDDIRLSVDRKHVIWENLEKAIRNPKAPEKQRRKKIYALAIASTFALAALFAGVFYIPNLLKKTPPTVESAAVTTAQTFPSIAEITTAAPRIVYGKTDVVDDFEPSPGTYYLSGGVTEALKDPQNESALFYVQIKVFYSNELNVTTTFLYEGKTLDEWGSDPSLREYQDGLNAYSWEKERALTDYEISQFDTESFWAKTIEEWDALWDLNHDTNPSTKYAEAKQAFNVEKEKEVFNLLSEETSRLESLGLDVSTEQRAAPLWPRIVGYLTKEQIRNFPCGDYGYYILWADRGDIIDD